MANSIDKLAKELMAQMVASDNRKPHPYDAQAEVLRIQDDVAWVHIPGGVEETPVRLTINAKKGDLVNIRVANGSAWITGNSTNPPTDDSTANYAVNISNEVKKDVTVLNTVVAEEIEATNARFNDVEADTAKIHNLTANQLNATVGYIGDLLADNISASDISADHAMIEELDVESMAAATAYIRELKADDIEAEDIVADHATVGSLDANYAQIDAANVTDLSAQNAWVNKLMVQTGLLAHEGAIFTLDAIQVNAANITAGTLDVERLIVTVEGEKYMVHVNPSTGTPSYEKLDGNIVEPRTITADKIVAHDITVQEITTENLVGTNGWINLNLGRFFYGNGASYAASTNAIEWNGTTLKIKGDIGDSVIFNNYSTTAQMNTAIGNAVDNIEVGGRNLLRNTNTDDSSILVFSRASAVISSRTGGVSVSEWGANNALRIVGSGATDNTPLILGGNTSRVTPSPAATVNGQKYTHSIYIKNNHSTKKIGFKPNLPDGAAEYLNAGASKRIIVTGTGNGSSYIQMNIQTEQAGDAFDFTLWHPQIEYGTKATDWTPAPEDVQAEIDAKKSVHTLDTSYSYTYANILTYSAEGYSAGWNVSSSAGVKVGDTVRLKVTVSDMSNAPVYVIGTVTAINSATRLTMTSHGLDTTIIDGGNILTNSIGANQIAANAITVGKMNADTQAQVLNSNIEVGGRNLARGTASMAKGSGSWSSGTWRDSGASNTYNYTVSDSPVAGVNKGIRVTTATAGTRYGVAQDTCPMQSKKITFSVWAKGTSGGTISIQSAWWSGIPSATSNSKSFTANGSWQYLTMTSDLTGVTVPNGACSIAYMYWTGVNANDTCVFVAPKLEYGTKATDWTPAPEDEIGTNLLSYPYLRSIFSGSTYTTNGITYTLNKDGTITATGTATANAWYQFTSSAYPNNPNGAFCLPAGTYTISGCPSGGASNTYRLQIVFYELDGSASFASTNEYGSGATITTTKAGLVRFEIGIASGHACPSAGYTFKPMLEAGSTAHSFVSPTATEAASQSATKYLTRINDNGIRIHPSSTENNSVVINADGMEVFKGGTGSSNSVAFYGDTARIGRSAESHIEMDYHSMQLIDKEGNTYFYVSDLRNQNGIATVVDKWIGDGSRTFSLNFTAENTTYTVKVNGSVVSSGVTKNYTSITFTTAPSDGATIEATYTTTDSKIKAYTLGTRKSGTGLGAVSIAEGYNVEASGVYSHAEGQNTTSSDIGSHAEGTDTIASGSSSHAEGHATKAYGVESHAEGNYSIASMACSHAEGVHTEARGSGAHAEGYYTTASGTHAHAEGRNTTASGEQSHSEGYNTTASNTYAHAEGNNTTASGLESHSEGYNTTASGACSHAGGNGTIAKGQNQTAIGKYNVEDTTSLFIVGNGDSSSTRKNAFSVSTAGDVVVYFDDAAGSGTDYEFLQAVNACGWSITA